jgi:hypothetical protein
VGHEVSAHIKTPGEGADKLYEDLRGQLTEAYKNAAHRPPVVEKLLAYKTMDEFSRATGFERVVDGHIESSTLHMGDSLTVTPDGRSLVFLEAGTPHEALIHASSLDSAQGATGVHVLIQETPQHEAVVLSQQSGWLPARAYGAQPQAEAHQASTTSARGDAAGDAHIAELNRAQTVGRSAAQAVTRPAETKSESSAPHSELPPDAIQTGAEYARQHPN